MTLRDKIAEAVQANFYATYRGDKSFNDTADAILDVIREGVKPLEWVNAPEHMDCDIACRTGIYQICNDDGMSLMWVGHDEEATFHEGPDAAKAAAQADYTSRILSALGIDQ